MAIAARNQPQGLVRTNPKWTKRGLKFAFVPGNGWTNAASLAAPLASTGSYTKGVSAVGITFDGGQSAQYPTTLDAAKGLTVISIWRARPGQYRSNDGTPILLSSRTSGNTGWGWGRAGAAAGTVNNMTAQFLVFHGVAGYTEANFPIDSLVDTPVACRYDPATGKISWFSFGQRSSPDTAAGVPTTGANLALGGSGPYPASGLWIDRAAVALAFESALSDAEIRTLTSTVGAVWQAFDAPSQSQFPMAAAATGVSGGITWAEASDSVAAAGSVKVTGAASWTEAADSAALAATATVSGAASWTEASDALAAAGSVGNAVSIAASWTEPSDTAAIAGTAQVNAAGAWTEASDTVSIAGSAGNSVAGNITWTEAADVTAVAGSISITAAGSWTEAGDSAAIVVNVAAPQSAALSWTEAPDSIAIAASVTAQPVAGTIAWTEQADIAALPVYPMMYAYTLMRSSPVSTSGYISSSATQYTLMRSDPLYAVSAIRNTPLNYVSKFV